MPKGVYKKTEAHKEKLRTANLGKKQTEETKKKKNAKLRGMKRSPETRLRMREAFRGEKSHFWKGGVTPLMRLIRECFKMKEWRLNIFSRDDYTCRICNKKGGELQADHFPKMFAEIFYENNIKNIDEALACKKFWDINNGRTLCYTCHKATETYAKNNLSKNMQVRFFNPALFYAKNKEELLGEINRVLESGKLVLGSSEDIQEFERQFADFIGTKHAVMCGSGTQALFLAYKSAGIGLGDEIILPSHTFVASMDQVAALGAKPILVDIGEGPLIDPSLIEKAITTKTKAIVPVHLEGCVADMDAILDIAKRHNLIVIEDAAQAIGAEYKGKKAGSMGLAGCYSFFPAKVLGSFGNAGMVVTNDDEIARRAEGLRRNWSIGKEKSSAVEFGMNMEPDGVQAAWLKVALRLLPERLKRRQEIAEKYDKAFSEKTPLYLPLKQEGRVYQDYVIRTRTGHEKDELLTFLRGASIGFIGHDLRPNHKYTALGLDFSLPKTEEYIAMQVRLPCNPDLTDEEVDYIIEKVTGFYR